VGDYDDYLYDDFPFGETHPDRLEAIATLFGLRPAPATRCRVLEIGAGRGGNLLPLAAALPESSFVGFDLAARPIAIATELAGAAGLSNVDLRAVDVRHFEDQPGSFDYIICHGVYSWVPPDAREAILRVVRTYLAPHGVAYISFNTLPGWYLRGGVRAMLLREVGTHGSPEERVARAREFLRFLAAMPAERSTAQAFVRGEVELLAGMSDRYLFYEHLVEHNHPQYFADFAADLGQHGLQYMADAFVSTMMTGRLGEAAETAVLERGHDVLSTEHALDVLDTRCFRRALICRAEAPLDRRVPASRLAELTVSSVLAPASEHPNLGAGTTEAFVQQNTELQTDNPLLKAALVSLSWMAPGGLPFPELCAAARRTLSGEADTEEDRAHLARNLLGLYTRGAIDHWSAPRPIAAAPAPRPLAFRWARLQAALGLPAATNLLHQSIAIDAFDCALLRRMDGSRDLNTLIDGALADAREGKLSVSMNDAPCLDRDIFAEITAHKLARLASAAFLVAP
jgi:SAM-dependent methyltransferase